MRHRDADNWEPLTVLQQADEELRRIAQNQPTGRPAIMPCPPGLDPEKWAALDRKTRRALWRHHRKVARRGQAV